MPACPCEGTRPERHREFEVDHAAAGEPQRKNRMTDDAVLIGRAHFLGLVHDASHPAAFLAK